MKSYKFFFAFCALLVIACNSQVLRAEPAQPKDWRVIQTWANFNKKNDAAPIHNRQLYRLYPTRVIANGEALPLHYHGQQPSLDDASYHYQGETRSLGDYIQGKRVTGLLVIRDGLISHESYYHGADADSPMIAFSTSKSIVSLLVGIAVNEGYIRDINDLVTVYLPELKESGFDGASIKNVLQMTTALVFPGESPDASGEGRDIASTAIKNLAYGDANMRSQPLQARHKEDVEHGEQWQYLNTNTQVLALLLERATGKKLSLYMEEKIWKKLGAEAPAYWIVDSPNTDDAFEHGWMGFNAILRDYGRIGLMMLNDGRWNGETIIPENWIRDSITPDNPAVNNLPPTGFFDYGFQWWVPEGESGEFMTIGHAGQLIYVNPARNSVIVQTAADPEFTRPGVVESVSLFRSLLADARSPVEQELMIETGESSIQTLIRGTGPAIVLIPSLGRGASDFSEVADMLVQAGYRVVLPEPRGIGLSTGPMQNTSLHDWAGDIAAVITEIGAPVVVVGHALGNRIARTLSSDHPELVSKIILLAAGGKVPIEPEIMRALVACFDETLPPEEHLAAVRLAFFADGNNPQVWAGGWYPLVAKTQIAAAKATSLEDWWSGGTVPMLVIQALDDTIAVRENGEFLAQEFPTRVRLVEIPNAGHAMLPEQPTQIVRVITDWLSE